jgi:hypothetical protein
VTERPFKNLDSTELVARLRAAEDVCVLYGWTGFHTWPTERSKALQELWYKWHDLAGPHVCDRTEHPHLTDEYIVELARKRDATREEMLRNFFGDQAVDE